MLKRPRSEALESVFLAVLSIALLSGAIDLPLSASSAGAQTLFVDVTAGLGLGDYRAESGDGHGPGAVFADLDGFPDLYLIRAWGRPNELYLNVSDGGAGRRFERAVDDGGAGDPGDGTGAVAADYDNDGDLDLYVLNSDQPNVLFQNQIVPSGALGFVDVTASTDPTPGVTDDQLGLANAVYKGVDLDNSLTAAWADVDRDGEPDLYVGNHNSFYTDEDPPEGPFAVPGRRDVFYMNNGDGTFTDATMTYGVTGFETESGEPETANQRFSSSNAVEFADLDNDGWPDLIVTNKVGGPDDRDMIYRNLGADGTGTWLGFEVVTYDLVPTFGDRTGGAMGVDVGDPDRDGDLDLYFTDWSDLEPGDGGANDYWINQLAETGVLGFEHSEEMPAQFSWGTQFQDFDNDSWLDLHVGVEYGAPDRLYRNLGGGLMADEAPAAGVDQTGNARGVVTADYDRDGWVDLLVVRTFVSQPSILYENRSDEIVPGHHFLTLRLVGRPGLPGTLRSTRDALGARVLVAGDFDGDGAVTANERLLREVVSGSSNAASTSSLELEFGVGLATEVAVRILWPSGRRTTAFNVAVDRFLVVDEALVTGFREAF